MRTFRYIFPLVLLVGDFFFILFSFLLAYQVRFSFFPAPLGIPPYIPYIQAAIFISLISIVVFKWIGRYRSQKIYSFLDEFYTTFISLFLVWAFSMSFTFIFRGFEYSRVVFLGGFLFCLMGVNLLGLILHQIQVRVRKRGYDVDNVLVVGNGGATLDIADRIRKYPELGYKLVEVVTDVKGLPHLIKKYSVSEIFLPLSYSFNPEVHNVITSLEQEKVKFVFIPDILGMITTRFKMGEVEGIPLLFLEDIPLRGPVVALKRSMDIAISSIGFIITLPVFLLICFLIKYSKYSTPGPALFKQERIGKNGKIFTLLKFRTMIIDAEVNTGPIWAKEDDERRTKIGIFLRKVSLDELPQLINVIRGEMSIVGPRPERPFFVEQFKKEVKRYLDRHKVKPGITGWAQINELRGNCDINLRTQYDLYYVDNWSLFFDIKIILRTMFEFLFHKTAY